MDSLNKPTLADMMPIIRMTLAEGKHVRFTPQGTSMLPLLYPGRDTVVLSPLPEKLKKYDLVLYQRANGQFVLHRIIRVGETYTCMGDHQFHKETGLEYRQMIGLVTEFVRNGRSWKVSAFGYRVYCRIWHYSRFLRRGFLRLGRIFAGGKTK